MRLAVSEVLGDFLHAVNSLRPRSYLGVEFVYEALRKEAGAGAALEGRRLRFLANVDPTDVARALEVRILRGRRLGCSVRSLGDRRLVASPSHLLTPTPPSQGLNPETTLVVIISKTFTTAETMLNARTLRKWLVDGAAASGASEADIVAKHMVAVSTAVPRAWQRWWLRGALLLSSPSLPPCRRDAVWHLREQHLWLLGLGWGAVLCVLCCGPVAALALLWHARR